MTKAGLDKRPSDVSAMFDQIAERYDLLNDVLSLGQDRLWRRFVAATVAARPGERVLDLAAGTGTSSRTFTTAGAYCVACDFSLGMLQVGARKAASRRRPGRAPRAASRPGPPTVLARGGDPPGAPRSARGLGRASRAPDAVPAPGPVRFAAGDALALPFAEASFDAATVGFGARNLDDLEGGLRELRRVLRPGARIGILEITRPHGVLRPFYKLWFDGLVPLAGKLLPGGSAYTYLPASVRRFPEAKELSELMQAAGFEQVRYRLFAGGIVALHTGTAR